MIELQQISKIYGDRTVLQLPALTILKGEKTGLLGNNGAGKTTLLSIMLDLVKPNTGTVINNGVEVAGSEAWKQYTAAYLDEGFLISFLTPEEYFEFVGGLYGVSPSDAIAFAEKYQDIFAGEVLGRNKLIRDLSKGNQKKVGLVASLIGSPDVLFWDEPFANLDPSTQLRIKELIQSFGESRTFVLSSHDLHHVYDTCQRVLILDLGRLVHDLRTADLSLKELVGMFGPAGAQAL